MSKPKNEYVQDFIPIKNIRHGIVETTDGRYIKILEIEPINFMLRSEEEQFGIISSFANWLKISPMRLQFKSVTRKADSEKHIAMLREELKREDNPRCKELSEGYIGLIRDVGSREALTRRFFLIFQFEDFQRTDDFGKIYGMIQAAEQNARAYFAQCGNNILQPQNEDEAVAEILYMYFNRRSCTDEPFADRVQRIILDRMKMEDKTLGVETAEDFTPYTVAHLGDTLFIANIGNAGNSLLLFSIKKGERLGTLQTWQHDGGEKSFGSPIEAIVPSGNRLYVAERQSRIHVFRLPELSYLTCIGNGQWSGPVFQAQAMTVKDGLIFARDKNGMVSIYKEEDATPENYQKVNRYRRASGNGSPGNNSFACHFMQPDAEGHLLLTDYEGKKIRVLDPALVNDDLANDASIDLDDLSLSPGFKPKTLALCGERWYATGDNDAINIYERQPNEWSKQIKSIKGYAFSQPARIYAQHDSVLWVSDTHSSKRALVKMLVHKGEIRE